MLSPIWIESPTFMLCTIVPVVLNFSGRNCFLGTMLSLPINYECEARYATIAIVNKIVIQLDLKRSNNVGGSIFQDF
jgi:hypothetical protein